MQWKIVVARRSATNAWVYVACAIVAIVLAVLAAGMEGEYLALIPYVPIIVICLVQLFRPTLLGWFLLLIPFFAYVVGIILNFQPPFGEYVFFLALLGFPTVALLVSRPKPLPASTENPESAPASSRRGDGNASSGRKPRENA